MTVDPTSFRMALGQFATGVTVVTTRDASGRPLGLTVSAFCSVSLHPPLVLVCIDHHSEINAGMRESGQFAVNVLAEDQEDVSRRFAAPGRAKSDGFPFVEGKHGLPLVTGALAHVECRVRSFHDEGDHAVWVGDVRSLATHPGRPLLYHAGSYGRIEGAGGVARPAAIGYKG
jgi:3-hydroxy-9,10-secoandrosta-1,3,5(10)-triene-9,17-dione monooxygenase reductase component